MEASHQISIIFMLIIIVAPSESGLSPGISSAPIDPPQADFNRGTEGCHFPGRYEGNWFQSGVTLTITISRNIINTKGRCLEAEGEKYLIFNERESCYRCVVFHEKHHNLLQYKETFCVPDRRSIKSLCSTITGDANLFAMFRLDAVPIECPFRAPLTLTYDRGHGECRYPLSSVDSCIHPSRILFNFQACPDVPGTESTAEELQCLASWKEGSYRYLVGLIKYRHHASYEERFRCFVYEKVKKGLGLLGGYGNGNSIRTSPLTFNSSALSPSSNGSVMYRVSQSGDATCNGLTPYEGSRTMTLRRGQSVKPCYFPTWLQIHPHWNTMDQKTTFIFNSSTMKIINSSASGDNFGHDLSTLTRMAVCSQIIENPTLNEFTTILHMTSAQCRNGYVCTRFFLRDPNVVELQMGLLARSAEDACHSSYFEPGRLQYITLTSSGPIRKKCPSLGHFGITNLVQEGRKVRDACVNNYLSISVGCSRKQTIQFQSTCSSENELVSEYSCHGWWEDKGINYLVTTTASSGTSSGTRKYCFIYREVPVSLQSRSYQQKLSKPIVSGDSFSNTDFDTDDLEDEPKIFQFSSVAESCRRDIAPGVEGFLAFNVTSTGRCSSASPQIAGIFPRLLASCSLLVFYLH